MSAVIVAGVGMTKFHKPSAGYTNLELGEEAVRAALADAGVEYSDIQQAITGHVYGGSGAGQGALYGIGFTGIPIINVQNACATGSTALSLGRQLVESGACDCVLALGFEQMPAGALKPNQAPGLPAGHYRHRLRLEEIAKDIDIEDAANWAIACFGIGAVELYEEHGVEPKTVAEIVVKARRHAANNSRAIFRDQVTVEDVFNSPKICGPLRRLEACPPTCGAAAAVLVSETFAARRGISRKVAIRAQAMLSDVMPINQLPDAFSVVGNDTVREAARRVYESAGVDPADIQVAEIHDCFSVNEIALYESLGWAKLEDANAFVRDGRNTYGGQVVVNPSGGLLSKGHPLGATGLAQCAELTWQLRGEAGPRQVEGVTMGLAQNAGMGSAGVVTIYERVN